MDAQPWRYGADEVRAEAERDAREWEEGTMTTGSTLAILKSGRHLALAPREYETFDQFAEAVRTMYASERFQVRTFWYAWGREGQEYTPGEMREVFRME